MPTIDVSRTWVEYADQHMYHVKVHYGYNEYDSLISEIDAWVHSTFNEYDFDTLSPGHWYITTEPSTFALAFKLTWEGP